MTEPRKQDVAYRARKKDRKMTGFAIERLRSRLRPGRYCDFVPPAGHITELCSAIRVYHDGSLAAVDECGRLIAMVKSDFPLTAAAEACCAHHPRFGLLLLELGHGWRKKKAAAEQLDRMHETSKAMVEAEWERAK